MGMRDWLIIIVIVGIILILLDGYRRKRKDSIRVKLEKNIPPLDVESEAAAELPNGGARVIPREDNFEDEAEYNDDDYQDYGDEKDDDDQIVPVLMDAVNIDKDLTKKELSVNSLEAEESKEDTIEEDSDWEDDLDDDDPEVEHAEEEYLQQEQAEDFSEDYDESDAYDDEEELSSVRVGQREEQLAKKSHASKESQGRIEPTLGEMEAFSEAELDDSPARANSPESKKQTENKIDSNEATASIQAELFSESPEDFIQVDDEHDENDEGFLEPEEVIVINVMAKQGELFAGSDLLPILMQHDMRLGKMSIFHKHADSSDNGPVVFSMANMVKPGTFDVTQMEEFSTPGVSFFLQLPNAFGNMKSFEQMLNAADSIKESLNGDLKDEHRSVITRQTIEHCRQRIQDFELAQLSKK